MHFFSLRSTRFVILALGILAAVSTYAVAKPPMGNLFYDGDVVRTVVPPSATPNDGIDPFFVVTNGAEGQLGIAGVAPGDTNYHGGLWAFNLVTWNIENPPLLTSMPSVRAHESMGHLVVERVSDNDFRCPIQP